MENPFESIIERLNRIEKLLVSLVPTEAVFTNAHFNKEILTLKELCSYLEFSASHIYKLTSKHEIPFSKRGKKLYFSKTDIDKWLTKHKITTKDELRKWQLIILFAILENGNPSLSHLRPAHSRYSMSGT